MMLVAASVVRLAAAPTVEAQCDEAFSSAVNYSVASTPRCVAIGDVNGDGRPDCNEGCPNAPPKTEPGACE